MNVPVAEFGTEFLHVFCKHRELQDYIDLIGEAHYKEERLPFSTIFGNIHSISDLVRNYQSLREENARKKLRCSDRAGSQVDFVMKASGVRVLYASPEKVVVPRGEQEHAYERGSDFEKGMNTLLWNNNIPLRFTIYFLPQYLPKH